MTPIDRGLAQESPTVLTIDLAAIVANWRLVAARHPRGRAAAVVKADAYGCGLEPVARALHGAGARLFFTAHLSEAAALRAILPGTDVEIGVFNGLLPGEADTYRHLRLLPILNDLGQIAAWSAHCRALGSPLPACVHVDTGMRRLGLPPDELARLVADPAPLAAFEMRYLLSHLACGDTPEHALNVIQARDFAAASAALPAATGGAMLAASSGAFLGPEFAFDLYRPGFALYGGNPTPGRPNPMRPVISLTSRIVQLRDVPTGTSVGYGATWRADRPTRLATLALGYADGFLRALSSRAVVHLDGVPLPVVGRVSMDLVTVDVTACPEIALGQALEVIGPSQDIDAVAERAGTIGYEILTGLGARYARAYREWDA